jgi:DNA polymerase delta subunit 1
MHLSIVGAQVFACHTETELLRKWREFVREVDPDFIIGYNIMNFDLPYLLNRSTKLKVDETIRVMISQEENPEKLQCDDFAVLGRITGSKSRVKDEKFSNKAWGTRESKSVCISLSLSLSLRIY